MINNQTGFLVKKDNESDLYEKLNKLVNDQEMQMANYKKMEQIRARAQDIVKDVQTAESLKPYYNQKVEIRSKWSVEDVVLNVDKTVDDLFSIQEDY